MLAPSDGVVEEWIAAPDGGFVRAQYDMPMLLTDASIPHIYDRLCAEDCASLWRTFERLGREDFLSYLRDEIQLANRSDRQLFTNALSRAQRNGLFASSASAATQ